MTDQQFQDHAHLIIVNLNREEIEQHTLEWRDCTGGKVFEKIRDTSPIVTMTAWLKAGIDNNFIFFFSFFMKNVMKAEDSRIALDFYLQYEDKNYREVEKIALTAFLELPAEELKKMSKESKIICRRSLPEYFLTSRKYSKKNLAIS